MTERRKTEAQKYLETVADIDTRIRQRQEQLDELEFIMLERIRERERTLAYLDRVIEALNQYIAKKEGGIA